MTFWWLAMHTGGQDGEARVFDLKTGECVAAFAASDDTVNGIEFHPFLPLAATASGVLKTR